MSLDTPIDQNWLFPMIGGLGSKWSEISKLSEAASQTLTQSLAHCLETNTPVPHMVQSSGKPRARIPVKRFLACSLIFTDSPDHAGVSYTTSGTKRPEHSATAAASRIIGSFFIDLFS